MSTTLTRILRWPLWSWRNLTVTGAALLALLAVLGRATDGQPSQLAPLLATAEHHPRRHDDRHAHTGPTSRPARPRRPQRRCLSHRGPRPTWHGLRHGVGRRSRGQRTPGERPCRAGRHRSCSQSLEGTDPDQVPADRVVGDARLANASGTAATVVVPTDGGRRRGVPGQGGRRLARDQHRPRRRAPGGRDPVTGPDHSPELTCPPLSSPPVTCSAESSCAGWPDSALATLPSWWSGRWLLR